MDTGIFIRAEVESPDGGMKWDSVDIGDERLSSEVIVMWLRSRGGHNPWAENVLLALLDKRQIANHFRSVP